MRVMFLSRLSQASVLSHLAICVVSGTFISAAPAAAEVASKPAADVTVRFKRTNGPDRSALSSSETQDRSAGSNGRNRDNAAEAAQVVEEQPPIALQFSRETETSSRVAGSDGRARDKAVVSEEIAGFDRVELTPEALEDPAPNTPQAALAAYREQRLALFRAEEHQRIAYENYIRLSNLDPTAIAQRYPNEDFDAVLAKAKDTYLILRDAVARRQSVTLETLLDISGGRALSPAAIRELNGLLGV